MSEQTRKDLLAQIKRATKEEQSSFQTEYDRLGINPAQAPGRTRTATDGASGNASGALGRRVISSRAKRTKTSMGMPAAQSGWVQPDQVQHEIQPIPIVSLPSVGTNHEHTWEPNMPHIGSNMEGSVQISKPDNKPKDIPSKFPQSLDQSEDYDFCLIFKGNVVAIEKDHAKIEIFIESLLRTLDNVKLSDIMVFQRISFKFGAIVG